MGNEIRGDALVSVAVAVNFKKPIELNVRFLAVRQFGDNRMEEGGIVLKIRQ